MHFKWLIIAAVVILLIVIFMPDLFSSCIQIGKDIISSVQGVGEGLGG